MLVVAIKATKVKTKNTNAPKYGCEVAILSILFLLNFLLGKYYFL
jgi:hypothetical protein